MPPPICPAPTTKTCSKRTRGGYRLPSLRLLALLFACALAGAPAALAAEAKTSGRTLVVAGRPFFPIFAWSQCPDDVEQALAVGVNVFMGPCETASPSDVLARIGPRAYTVAPLSYRGVLEDPMLLGWNHVDEPENRGLRPQDLPSLAGRHEPTFLTLTSRFIDKGEGPTAYRAFAARADVVGFDLYPIAAHCGVRIRLGDVFEGQRQLNALAPGKPTYQWIETGPMEGWCSSRGPVTPDELRAQVWLAVAGGATGIGYFTHTWTSGSWLRFDVFPAVRDEIAGVNTELRSLSPALLARQVAAGTRAPVYAGARVLNGRVYLIAVNASTMRVTRTVRADPLARASAATVWREGRSVPVVAGTVRDTFEPLAVHVYVARLSRT